MDDNDIEFAVKQYKKKSGSGKYTFDEFIKDIKDHLNRRPMPYSIYDPFSLNSTASKLWNVLEMDMKEVVTKSGLDMAKFSRRFCIPYRTLQAWCDGTNPCPIYIKLMICEILKFYTRAIPMQLQYYSFPKNQ